MQKIAEIIAAEIAHRGSIPFARFMELALYCPDYGFYETEKDTVGKAGDYYTSVSVGSVFGELLACRFATWLRGLDRDPQNRRLCLVEAGAHTGQLAADVLAWFSRYDPDLLEEITYLIIEPSAQRRRWQQETLGSNLSNVSWCESLAGLHGLTAGKVRGIIFSNELLDSMPVHRLAWNRGSFEWFEWGVTVRDGQFAWQRRGPRDSGTGWLDLTGWEKRLGLDAPLLEVLPDGFVLEVCPAAERWWQEAAEFLDSGKLLTLDYGLTTEEQIMPERTGGTLRAYKAHRLSGNLLADPGSQDLTAHVNFDLLRAVGEKAGLQTELFERQGKFLTETAAMSIEGRVSFQPWTPTRSRQLQTLVHPDHLGARFRVLMQAR